MTSQRSILKNKLFLVSFLFVALIMLMSFAAPYVTPFHYSEQDLNRVLLTPNETNILGTDILGRDVYSRVIYGARVSLSVALIATLIGLVFGVAFGSVAGYVEGLADRIFVRVLDVFQSFPQFVLMVLISIYFHNQDPLLGMIMALSLVGWASIARLVRLQVKQIKKQPYVESAVVIGANPVAIIGKHILPNLSGSLLVLIAFQIPSHILYESFLSFAGLGLQPPFSSWGVLLLEGWQSLRSYPHLIFAPGMAVFLTMLSLNFMAESLRDYFDPRAQRQN